MKYLFLLVCSLIIGRGHAQNSPSVSVEKWLGLKSAASPIVSPDGRCIAFTQTATDWANNMYDVEI